ncbi:glutathione hydrolase 5 proenzyme [Channa argus]|uniref:glutathione hydrolase 5 proenzyme n=1 Tax=Channa argus TaxID=215402 RepID=UPI0029470856|nr:hypothetical protein Q8A73_019776 [Channa argus]
MAKRKSWLACCFIFAGLLCAVALACLYIVWFVDRGCPSRSFKHAAVSADSQTCSEIGRNILKQGGSAVDGAIAALLCTSVVNPQSMGIGGGSIITIKNATGEVRVYNFRETVPKMFKLDLLKDCPTSFSLCKGSHWIGVPGELRGYGLIHHHYGKLPWAKLFEPTIKLARDGIPMPDFLIKLLNNPIVKKHVENSSLCEVFCNNKTTVLGKGDVLRFPKLAETMETIAKEGPDVFYTGKIGQALIQDVKAAGGTLEAEDLKSFRVNISEAWTVDLGNAKMYIPPPPAGGAILGFIVGLMKEYFLTPNSKHGDKKMQMYHHYIEAVKFANGQKRRINDPFYNRNEHADHLIQSSFIKRISKEISSNHTNENSYYKRPFTDSIGTTHVSVLDENGLAVSATSTINHLFGGGIYSPQTGIILNNELSDFCGRADTLRAGEQPPSSMTPAILETDSGGILMIGGSGGSMITSAVALSIINHLWLGMDLEKAIAAPIVFVDSQNKVNFELGFDKSVIDGLKALGHQVGQWPYFFNVVNAVEKENDCIVAVSDKRKQGMSAGY